VRTEPDSGSVPHGALEAHALWFTAPHTAEFRPESVPFPRAGEVRVRAVASALSQGTEMLVYRGEVPADLPLDLPTLAGSFGFPIKYGYATVGRVLDMGASVEDLVPGDLVFVHHPHQDVFVVPAAMPVRLSDELDPLLGLFVANLETALNIVHDTPLRLGETALVFGQGVVGLLVAQLLRLAGAGRVLVVDPLKKRRDLARAVGVDETFEPGEDLPERVLETTAGRGADVAVEVSGSGAALQAAIEAVTVEGGRRGVVVRHEARNPLARGTFSSRESAAPILTGRAYEPGSRFALESCPPDGDGARSAAPTTPEGTYLPPLPFRRGAGGLPARGRVPWRGGTGNPHARRTLRRTGCTKST
jgi:2-desacetyl-2-hydroxyethyl bacteriochlorophyllide A dehydrogenase